MSELLPIAIIGTRFMGRAHSNAWGQVHHFFDLSLRPVLHTACGRDARATAAFAKRWDWQEASTDWQRVVRSPDVKLIDVATPNHLHAVQAIAALESGHHVACEKPLAGTLEDARRMRDAARERAGLRTFVWFNYRRCPAIAFAHRLIREGKLGSIHHVRAQYLQDWGGPKTPFSWRFDRDLAGSGAHGDLNAHSIDLARFLTGDEIVEVSGAIEKTFYAARVETSGTPRTSTVDDCVLFLARFRSGAVGSFEASRVASGHQNRNCIEINGESGSIKFDFERMNELQWWDGSLPSSQRGWSRIMCTTPGDHPYADAYWPPAHLIGYEHGFISQAADMLRTLAGQAPVVPLPDFEDAYRTQRVLHGALLAARERRAVDLEELED